MPHFVQHPIDTRKITHNAFIAVVARCVDLPAQHHHHHCRRRPRRIIIVIETRMVPGGPEKYELENGEKRTSQPDGKSVHLAIF